MSCDISHISQDDTSRCADRFCNQSQFRCDDSFMYKFSFSWSNRFSPISSNMTRCLLLSLILFRIVIGKWEVAVIMFHICLWCRLESNSSVLSILYILMEYKAFSDGVRELRGVFRQLLNQPYRAIALGPIFGLTSGSLSHSTFALSLAREISGWYPPCLKSPS
jgi:hypothetical protein